jgi:type II secretory pathway component PulL
MEMESESKAKAITDATLAFAKTNSLDLSQVILAVASESVLFATIPGPSFDAIKTNQALRFELESLLPCDAEGIVADSIVSPRGSKQTSVAAVALETAHVESIVKALEDARCKIQCIVPRSMLAFEQASIERLLPASSLWLWVMGTVEESRRVEVVAVDSNRLPIAWQLCDMDPVSIEQNVRILNIDSLPVFVVGNSQDAEILSAGLGIEHQIANQDLSSLIKKRAGKLLTAGEFPWVDLRRDVLASQDPWRRYQGSIVRLAVATCVFFAVACGTFAWRATHYQSLANQYKAKQEDIFRETFPGQRVPAAILARLKSEYAKAKGVRTTDTATALPESALSILRKIIESFTKDFSFEVLDIRIENNRLAMDIELSTQQDAGKIAAALARQGFRVEPPATTLVDGDRIRATLIGAYDPTGNSLSSNPDNRALR